jgi:hypothetical protein
MIHAIRNIDDNKTLYFDAITPYDAMKKLLYYLSLSDGKASKATINKTESNTFLYVVNKGKTYATKL